MSNKKNLLGLIENQRSKKKVEKFKGTFLDYLEKVQDNTDIPKLPHKRLFDSINASGVEILDESDPRCRKIFDGDKVRVYNYFKDEFFGMENVIHKIMRYLMSGALKGEESRQMLLLMGPVGTGKSALTEHIKQALENCTEPIYCLEDCPMNEEPLHLVPRSLRAQMSEALGVQIEGDLCPICRHRLMEEFDGKYENFPVVSISFSQRGRRGIASVPPMDPNSQDVSVLIGSEDLSKLDKYSEDDPRVLSLNGAFNIGNRGIVEFIEVFKNDIEFLHTIITATQEKRIPSPGKNDMIHFDGVIWSHCNEAEWNKFKSEHTNEAVMSRIVPIEVPYVLELDQEIKIYEKMIKRSDFKAHIAPHTLKVASIFSIMSRLKTSQKCDLMTKMKIYNGQEVVEKNRVKKIDIKDLRDEAGREGMSGIGTRFVIKAIDNALVDSERNMITPISVIDSLVKQVKEQVNNEEDKKRYLEFLQKDIRQEYLTILEKEISKAFIGAYEEQAQSLFDNYLDNAIAYSNKQRIKDRVTKEEREPDDVYMKSIEEQIGITGTSRDGFRKDVASFMFAMTRRSEKIDYKSYAPIREAIESYLMESVRKIARIVTKSKTRDDDQRKKYNDMITTLITEYGYTEDSAEEILVFASNNLWRDS